MQLTANIAVLAAVVASTAPSVFSLPLAASNSIEARDYELDLEAREIADFEAREFEDLELAARDLIDEYYQAREVYDELDARSFDNLNYLDARGAPAAATPSGTSAAATSASASPSPSATSATPTAGAAAPATTSTGAPGDVPHHYAHIPSVLIRALTDKHHPKLKHYAEIQLHIFNTLVELSDGEANDNGIKESPEVEKLAKEILQLKRWHRHHLHHGHHSHKHSAHADGDKKDGEKPAHEKHDGAKDSAVPTPSSSSATPSTSGAPHHGHHDHKGHHHHDLYHAKIHELKVGSHKADRYIARARLHKDRLHLISLGPTGDNDEAYEAAVKHEKQWLERHQKLAAHLQHHGHDADPSATGSASGAPSATSTSTSTSTSAAPTGTGAPKTDKPAEPAAGKTEKSAEPPKTAQGVKRRALRRRGFF